MWLVSACQVNRCPLGTLEFEAWKVLERVNACKCLTCFGPRAIWGLGLGCLGLRIGLGVWSILFILASNLIGGSSSSSQLDFDYLGSKI